MESNQRSPRGIYPDGDKVKGDPKTMNLYTLLRKYVGATQDIRILDYSKDTPDAFILYEGVLLSYPLLLKENNRYNQKEVDEIEAEGDTLIICIGMSI